MGQGSYDVLWVGGAAGVTLKTVVEKNEVEEEEVKLDELGEVDRMLDELEAWLVVGRTGAVEGGGSRLSLQLIVAVAVSVIVVDDVVL